METTMKSGSSTNPIVFGVYLFCPNKNEWGLPTIKTNVMRIYFLFIGILCLAMGCKSRSAFDYSQKLVSIEKSLIPDIRAAQDKIAGYFTSQQFDSAAVISQQME